MKQVFAGRSLCLAPLVGGSELAFRMTARHFNSEIVTYTPMVLAQHFKISDYEFDERDRPLVLQVAGPVGHTEQLIRMINHEGFRGRVDAVDLNCGCPQGFALKRKLGAGLLGDHDALVDMVRRIAEACPYPLSVKLRMTEHLPQLVGRLLDAGATGITLHARYPHQKGQNRGWAEWSAIRELVQLYGERALIIGNGNVDTHEDAQRMLSETGAHAAMIGYAALLRPSVFSREPSDTEQHLRVYFERFADTRVWRLIDAQRHVAWLLKEDLAEERQLKPLIFQCTSLEELRERSLQLLLGAGH